MPQVVLYEDHSRKRLLDFLSALKGLREVAAAAAEFDVVSELERESPRLAELTRAGSWERCGRGMSDLAPAVAAFEAAFDWGAAAASGRIVPRGAGVDGAWDTAQAATRDAEASLQAYLKEQRVELSCPAAKFVNLNKDVYLLEVGPTLLPYPQPCPPPSPSQPSAACMALYTHIHCPAPPQSGFELAARTPFLLPQKAHPGWSASLPNYQRRRPSRKTTYATLRTPLYSSTQVPAALEKRAPAVFEKCSMTKDVVRFTSPALELLKQDLAAANEANEAALQVKSPPPPPTRHQTKSDVPSRDYVVMHTAGRRGEHLACAPSCRYSHFMAWPTTPLWATHRPLTFFPHRAPPLCPSQGIFTRQLAAFGAKATTWRAAVAAAAELDVLTSLALAADGYTDGPTCVPTLLPPTSTSSSDCSAGWTASGLRHPCAGVGMGGGGGGGFVPNDTALGGAAPPFLLLTGPNMGGKSTLLRQVSDRQSVPCLCPPPPPLATQVSAPDANI